MSETLIFFVLAAGVIGSFTAFGFAQEAVTKTDFDGERFQFSTFLVLLQSLGNATVAGVVLLARNKSLSGDVPVSEWLVAALGYFGAHKFGLMALSYISFPMQTVCKSCKAIPVMVGEKIFAKKRHSLAKTLGVLCMCVGVVMFTLLGPAKASKKAESPAIGLLLVLAALACDGLYGPYQTAIQTKAKDLTAWHLMFNMNLYQGLLSLALSYDDLPKAIAFCARHPRVIHLLALFSAAMALGNIFIYQLQAAFGSLEVTKVTTTRKLVSVLASVFFFGHALTLPQWLAVFIVIFNKQEGTALAALFSPLTKKHKSV
ncbi:hypothetical protein CTAYLR_010309 [Chrysophaeum taylorii]|uniref:Uncharacterized protein n=1 Tax=Chrysophaeum taylorii TaxID=2483200 RepID=A0AAD7UMS7_9STRA|nr:hypothetical protein CTAYLR_010309 [Chrysophaeum taylorii]